MLHSVTLRRLLLLLSAGLAGCDDLGPAEPVPDDPLRPAATRVVDVALDYTSTCVLTADGLLHCWGENRFGEFGTGTLQGSATPVLAAGGMRFTSVHGSMGTPQMCGITADHTGYCWGYNSHGEVGSGIPGPAYAPAPIAGGIRFSALAGSYHTCGVDTEGAAYCWGSDLGGQLGSGTGSSGVPVRIASSAAYTAVTNGLQFSCALRREGQADCWGHGVGMGSGPGDRSVNVPTPVSGGLAFLDISAGEDHVCALTREGVPYCWGKLTQDWPEGFAGTPVRIPGENRFVQVASATRVFAYGSACALTAGGKAYCWYSGLEPIAVPGNHRFAGITGGSGRFCGYTPGGAALCWAWTAGSVNGREAFFPGWPVPIPALSARG